MEEVEIRFSETDGRYLVALRTFHQGAVIAELPRTGLSQPDMYSIEVGPGVHVDCAFSPVGAMNHSCDPNAAVREWRVVAWKCIDVGEIITLDYKRTETKLAAPFNCLCGAKNCRGRIE
jgi:hypothetical protein